MQRGFNSLRGRSWFTESEFDDVPRHSLIPAFNVLIFFTGHWMRRGRSWSFAIRSIAWTRRACPISIGWSRSSSRAAQHRMVQTSRGRMPRSWSDRAAIAARLSRDLTSFIAESLQQDPTTADRDPGPRSTPDRGLIVARSWPDHATIGALFEAKFKPIHPGFEATMPLSANRSHDALIPPPRTRQLPIIFGPILPLKSHVFLLCSLTFDWLVKKLSKFRERS